MKAALLIQIKVIFKPQTTNFMKSSRLKQWTSEKILGIFKKK